MPIDARPVRATRVPYVWSTLVIVLGSRLATVHAQHAGSERIPRPLPVMVDDKPPPAGSLIAPRTDPHARQLPLGPRRRSNDARPMPGTLALSRVGGARVDWDTPGDGRIWVHGEDYKASFDAASATYIPFFGSNAPHNFPVSFRLREITADGVALAFDADISPVRSGSEVVYSRGAVEERYAISAGSVEQVFVIDRAPRAGEIVVRLDVSSELALQYASSGLELENELGAVHYGAALAVDARGRREPLALGCDGGSIEIRVPASFAARAAFPLAIDPLISTFSIDTSASDDFSADTAYDFTNDNYLVSYERMYSLTDFDVYEEILSGSGAYLSGGYIDFTADFWNGARVANNSIANQYLVVAEVGLFSGNPRIIRGRTVDAATNIPGAVQFTISGSELGEKILPAVGGDPEPVFAPSYYFVTWTRIYSPTDEDIHGQLVRADGSLASPSTILIDNSGGTIDYEVAISRSDGKPPASLQDWTIVWRRLNATESDIYGARVHWDGTITSSTFPVAVNPASDDYFASVSSLTDGVSGPREYLIAWTRGVTLGEIICKSSSGVEMNVSAAEAVIPPTDRVDALVETVGNNFVVTYEEKAATSRDVYAVTIETVNGTPRLAEGRQGMAVSSFNEFSPELVSPQTGGGSGPRCLIVWGEGNATEDIRGGFYEERPFVSFCSPGGDPPATLACPCGNTGAQGHGCGNSVNPAGALLLASGTANPDTLVFNASGMPATVACIYLQGDLFSAGSTFGDGVLCAGGTNIRLRTKVNVAGASQYPEAGDPIVSVRGGVTPGGGEVRFYQTFYRNSAAFCTSATFNITNGMQLVW